MRVLLAEDNAPCQRAVAKSLREAGFAVDVSAGSEEGLCCANDGRIDPSAERGDRIATFGIRIGLPAPDGAGRSTGIMSLQ